MKNQTAKFMRFRKKNKEEVRYYRKKEFLAMAEEDLIDFLPGLNIRSESEMGILKGWEEHFKANKIPYRVDFKPGSTNLVRLVKRLHPNHIVGNKNGRMLAKGVYK